VSLEREAAAALAALDRRSFLRLAALVGAAGLVPSGCSSVPAELAPPPDLRLRVLTPRSYATFTAAAARLAGPDVAALIATGRIHPGRVADVWLARSPDVAGPLERALLVLEFGVWPLVAKVHPFTSLDGTAQDRVLAGLVESRLALKRALWKGVRAFAMLAVYLEPEARALTGYPGPFGGGAVTIGDAMVPPRATVRPPGSSSSSPGDPGWARRGARRPP
jgi:hypothetical protein